MVSSTHLYLFITPLQSYSADFLNTQCASRVKHSYTSSDENTQLGFLNTKCNSPPLPHMSLPEAHQETSMADL